MTVGQIIDMLSRYDRSLTVELCVETDEGGCIRRVANEVASTSDDKIVVIYADMYSEDE